MFKIVILVLVLLFTKNGRCDDDEEGSSLRIGAFNIRIFGVTKMQNKEVAENLAKIIIRYDLLLIQEIRDLEGNSIKQLFKDVQDLAKKKIGQGAKLEMFLSERLGRSSNKEQYALIYRKDKLKMMDRHISKDPDDIFAREPVVAKFSSPLTAIKEFAVVGIHVKPRDAENEISNLTKVYDDLVSKYNINDVILFGDFNAGCDYIDNWDMIDLAKDKRFYWLIDNSVDTTSESSECPYDRIVVAGKKLLESIIPGSAQTFRYDDALDLNRNKTLMLSDHYPVEFQLYLHEEKLYTTEKEFKNIYDVSVNQDKTVRKVIQMRSKAIKLNYDTNAKFTKSGAYLEISVAKEVLSDKDIKTMITSFHKNFPEFVSTSQVNAALRYFHHVSQYKHMGPEEQRYQTLKDYYKTLLNVYRMALICDLKDRSKITCGVSLGHWFR